MCKQRMLIEGNNSADTASHKSAVLLILVSYHTAMIQMLHRTRLIFMTNLICSSGSSNHYENPVCIEWNSSMSNVKKASGWKVSYHVIDTCHQVLTSGPYKTLQWCRGTYSNYCPGEEDSEQQKYPKYIIETGSTWGIKGQYNAPGSPFKG